MSVVIQKNLIQQKSATLPKLKRKKRIYRNELEKTIKLPVRDNNKNDIIKDVSYKTTKLTKKRLINEKLCVSSKGPRNN